MMAAENSAVEEFVHDSEAYKRSIEAFRAFDSNQDGVISREELAKVFISMDPDHWDDKRVGKLMLAVDTNKDGVIHYEEFLKWLLSKDREWDIERGAAQLRGEKKIQKSALTCERRTKHGTRECIVLEIDQTNGRAKLGIEADGSDEQTLRITDIKKGGVFESFNREDTARRICVGDRIVDVNGVSGDSKLIFKELKKKVFLEISILPGDLSTVFSDKVTNHYKIDRIDFAKGHYSVLQKATTAQQGVGKGDQTKYCIKSVHKTTTTLEQFENMRNIMQSLDHPHVLRLYDVFENQLDYIFVTELCTGGEVLELVLKSESFSERQAIRLMKQTFAAVGYLHTMNICHRDVRADHLLLESDVPTMRATVKLVDFRVAARFEQGTTFRSIVMPPVNMAPECASGSVYDHRIDLWSLGVLMYLMISGYPPFVGETDQDTKTLIRTTRVSFPDDWNTITTEAKDLIGKLLDRVPKNRPSASQAITHPWIELGEHTGIDFPLHSGQENMRKFCKQNELKKAAIHLIARKMGRDELRELQDMFALLDKNGDQMVTFVELKAGLDRLGNTETLEDLQALMEGIDVDGSRRIDYTEFLAAAMDSRQHREETACLSAFQVFDKDGSGSISREELLQILSGDEVRSAVGQTRVDRVLEECDLDGDNKISFSEFMNMMRKDSSANATGRLPTR